MSWPVTDVELQYVYSSTFIVCTDTKSLMVGVHSSLDYDKIWVIKNNGMVDWVPEEGDKVDWARDTMYRIIAGFIADSA